MSDTEELLADIAAFLERHEMAPTKLGADALNNPNFVSDFREGKYSPMLRTVDKLREYMRKKNRGAL